MIRRKIIWSSFTSLFDFGAVHERKVKGFNLVSTFYWISFLHTTLVWQGISSKQTVRFCIGNQLRNQSYIVQGRGHNRSRGWSRMFPPLWSRTFSKRIPQAKKFWGMSGYADSHKSQPHLIYKCFVTLYILYSVKVLV